MSGAGPLQGLRVVEIASLAPAPFGCMLLADLGADVLRVERAGSAPSVSAPIGPLDRGRRSVAVNLKTPEGVAVVHRLVEDADVFVEGFRPGVAERLGIGPQELQSKNPRLVYARMTGWGQDGPLAERAGHDINYIAISGALEPVGRAGQRPNAPLNLLGDFGGGGAFLALGVLAALYEREVSGLGQVIDAAMVDGSSTLMAFVHGMRHAGQWPGERGTNLLDGGAACYDTYETADGKYVAVGAVEPQFYAQVLEGLGIAADTIPAQLDAAGWDRSKEVIGEAFKAKTRDQWTEIFSSSDACVSPVLSPWEAPLHPHNVARKSFVEVGGHLQPAPAPRFDRTPATDPVPMNDGGRDVAGALTWWGLDAAEVTRLVEAGAVV